MARIGLALSGGGSKGAFTVGVLKVIEQLLDPVPYPVIAGTSTGALISSMLATNRFARLVELYSTVQTENIVNPHRALVAAILGPEAVLFAAAVLGGRAIFDSEALRKTIEANVDFEGMVDPASETTVIFTTVDLQSGKYEAFDNRTHSAEVLASALLASSNMPVLTDPVDITVDGTTHQYVDGGVREFLPLRAVFDSGVEVDHIIAISTAPFKASRRVKPYDNIIEILGRTVDLQSAEVAKNDDSGAQLFNALLAMIANGEAAGVSRTTLLRGLSSVVRRRLKDKRAIPVTVIAPPTQIEMDSLTFDPRRMREVMKLGVKVGKKEVPRILETL